MLYQAQNQLIEYFMLFIQVLNAIVACLIFIFIGGVALLSYDEINKYKIPDRRPQHKTQDAGIRNPTTLSTEIA